MPIPACGRRCCAAMCPTCGPAPTTRSSCHSAAASIAALKETVIRHLFTYSFMPVLPDRFPRPEDRLADGRLIYDKFHDPAVLTTIGFGVESIGAARLEKQLAFSRALKAPSCIHVNETGTID